MSALIGHDAAIAAFRDAAGDGRLHHAWLITGPRGIGKARFAAVVARRLLAEAAGPPPPEAGLEVAEDHPVARLIAAGSHPDFRRLERLPREGSGAAGGELARNISIAQVRALQALFATTPSLSARRIVVIDSVDDLERAAANALLKNLEEPPAGTVFLLISHAPGRLLPTIRSRCRLLALRRLDAAATAQVIRAELPDAAEAEVAALTELADGAPGAALRFAGLDVAGLDAALATIAATGDPDNSARSALARSLALKAAQPRYEAFLERALAFIAGTAGARSGTALAGAIAAWEEARALAASAVPLVLDPHAVTFQMATLVAGLAPGAPAVKG